MLFQFVESTYKQNLEDNINYKRESNINIDNVKKTRSLLRQQRDVEGNVRHRFFLPYLVRNQDILSKIYVTKYGV